MSDQAETQNNSPPSELFSILSKVLASTPSEPTQSASAPATEPSKSGGDMLSALLSNPEIISKLPQILSVVKPLMEGFSSPSASVPVSRESQKSEPSQSTPAGHSSGTSHHSPDCRAALLYALKPYLKRERQEAIDYMVKLSKLGDILKSL